MVRSSGSPSTPPLRQWRRVLRTPSSTTTPRRARPRAAQVLGPARSLLAATLLLIAGQGLPPAAARADEPFDPMAARCGPIVGDPAEQSSASTGSERPADPTVSNRPIGRADPADPASVRLTEWWQHPVEAAIVDGFRPPSNPYGPGNRGLEYATTPGEPVSATADGTVTFAGQVGGRLFIVARHRSGLRVTYSYLAQIDVSVDDPVVRGQPIATADAGMHLTVRDGAHYIDPLPLMADFRCFIVRLVPEPPALAPVGPDR